MDHLCISVLCLLCLCACLFFTLFLPCDHLLRKAGLLALVCGVSLCICHFLIGILGQVWYLIESISDLCTLTYF